MKKTLTISGIECHFKSSAAIPRMYRLKFGRDIFVDMQNLKKQIEAQEKLKKETEGEVESTLPIDSLEMFENIAFLMHKHGDPSQPSGMWWNRSLNLPHLPCHNLQLLLPYLLLESLPPQPLVFPHTSY